MSLQIQVTVTDGITPQLQALRAKIGNLQPSMRSIGVALVALAKRSFREPGLRPAAWPAKKDGSVATLIRRGPLRQSVRVVQSDGASVTIGSDRLYAAIHQLGGQTKPHAIRPRRAGGLHWPGAKHPVKSVNHPGSRIPARPFFPVTPGGDLTAPADKAIGQVLRAYIGLR